MSHALTLLKSRGRREGDLAKTRCHNQRARLIDPQPLRAGQTHPNPRRISTRLNREAFFYVVPARPQLQRNPRPDFPEGHAFEGWKAAPPARRVISKEVADLGRRSVASAGTGFPADDCLCQGPVTFPGESMPARGRGSSLRW